MRVDTAALFGLAAAKQWSSPVLAKRLGIDYSYLYRVLKKEKGAGAKFITGLFQLCKEEGLVFDNYIIMQESLSKDIR
ncbi:MAG: hypothetical protein ACM3MK_11695 [Chitinophagales bacterium]